MRFASLRRSIAGMGIAAVTFAVAACGSGATAEISPEDLGPAGDSAWAQLVEAAEQEGSVTYLTGQPTDNLQELASRFESVYGIEVEIVRDNDANLQTKLAAEAETGRHTADIIATASRPWVDTRLAEGYFVPVTGPAFGAAEFDREKFLRDDDRIFLSSAAVLTYGWNTSRVPDGIDGYEGLLDPSLADGKIGVMLPVSSAIVDFYDFLGDTVSPDFVEKLAGQKPRTYPGAQAMAQALTSGEIAAALYTMPLTAEKEAGAPVDSGLPSPVFGAPFLTGVPATAPHPNAAQLFANFLVTKAGQEAVADRAGSVLPGISTAATSADDIWVNSRIVTADDTEAFRAEFARLFGSSQ
ncbi:ABC transporter substrate-binding protein [Rhodococcus sp. O3]|uniref:ABC transporter substrate-binding protein n=1 Tax=Rhodococcus sp. O3 TaxID=3404919 RepID=UPI003B675D17